MKQLVYTQQKESVNLPVARFMNRGPGKPILSKRTTSKPTPI